MSMSASILVVEPLAVIRESLSAALQAQGYLTLTAGDGEEAYEVAQFCPPTLALINLALPKLDGVELLQRWQNESAHADMPVVLLTDGCDLDAVQRATGLGVRHYLLQSSFTMSALNDLLQKLCPISNSATTPNSKVTPTHSVSPPPPSPKEPKPAKKRPVPPVVYHASISDNKVLKSMPALVSRPEIDDVIENAYRLPILASSRRQLEAELTSEEGSQNQTLGVIQRDPTLALYVLREANGPRFENQEPAINLAQAQARLGTEALGELVASLETWDLPGVNGMDFDGTGFWQHAVAVATLCADLTREAEGRPDEIETAYTAGLLHDVGRLVLAHRIGLRYAEVIETAEGLRVPLEDAEAHLLLETHATLMDKAMRGWGCGPELTNPVGLHHTPAGQSRHLAGTSNDLVKLVRFADVQAHALLLGHGQENLIAPVHRLISPERLDPGRLTHILEALPHQLEEARKRALPQSPVQSSADAAQQLLNGTTHTPHPVFVGLDQHLDALQQLVNTLNPRREPPNVALVYLGSVRERNEIGNLLRAADQQANSGKLPALVLSPKGNIELDQSITLGRDIRSLAMPVSPQDIVRQLGKLVRPRAQAA